AGSRHRGQPDAQRPMPAAGRGTAVRAEVDAPGGALSAISTLFRQLAPLPLGAGRATSRRRCGLASGGGGAPWVTHSPTTTADDHRELAEVARAFLTSQKARWAARSLLDTPDENRPGFSQDMVELGWLGLHVDEEHGGSGYGLPELVVVTEELGRAVAPGPFVP